MTLPLLFYLQSKGVFLSKALQVHIAIVEYQFFTQLSNIKE